MKILIFILLAALCSCGTIKHQPSAIKLTVVKVFRDNDGATVWAKRSYMLYSGRFNFLPDTVVPGKVLTVIPCPDTCKFAFKRIK